VVGRENLALEPPVPADELGAEDLSSAVILVMMAAQYWARQMVATSATLAITSMTAISAVEESIASDCVDRQPGRRGLCQCLRHHPCSPRPNRAGRAAIRTEDLESHLRASSSV
jgi:hypothetical protein